MNIKFTNKADLLDFLNLHIPAAGFNSTINIEFQARYVDVSTIHQQASIQAADDEIKSISLKIDF